MCECSCDFILGTLGLLYTKGEGCAVNKELSLKWLKKSADSGSIYGSGLLSHYYYTMKMYSKAVEIAKKYVFSFIMS